LERICERVGNKNVLLESLHSAFRFGPTTRQIPDIKVTVSDTETGFEEVGRIIPDCVGISPGNQALTRWEFGGTNVKLIGRGNKLFRPGSDTETVAAARDSAPLQQTPK
jgi:hypothetical protein